MSTRPGRSTAAALVLGLLVGLISGCELSPSGDDHAHGEEDHDHADEHAHDDGHDDGHDEAQIPGIVVTRFNDDTELFLEYPALVAGRVSRFAAHLTWLDDYRPVKAGQLTVSLTRNERTVARFRVGRPTRPGLYTPAVKPRDPGVFDMTLTWEQDDQRSVHRLAAVNVYASPDEVPADPETGAEGDITFLKEQQWRVPFNTAVVTERTLRASVPATGILRAVHTGDRQVIAPVSGRIQSPGGGFPEAGQQVRAGDVLAHIVPRLGGGTDLATLRLAVEEAEADLELARREERRLQGLLAKEAIPERRLMQARSQTRVVAARLTAARQRLASHQGAGSETEEPAAVPLIAGVTGTVAEVHAGPGTYVEEGAPLMRVVDRRRLWLEARVPEANAARLDRPAGAWFTPAGSKEHFVVDTGGSASLVSAGEVVDPASRTVAVIFALPNPGGLRVGTAADVRVWTGETVTAPAVPVTAVQEEAGEPVVYVEIGGESFARRVVSLGIRAGDYVAVTEGLEPGERVVTTGSYLVRLAGTDPAGAGHGHAH